MALEQSALLGLVESLSTGRTALVLFDRSIGNYPISTSAVGKSLSELIAKKSALYAEHPKSAKWIVLWVRYHERGEDLQLNGASASEREVVRSLKEVARLKALIALQGGKEKRRGR
jgi:hypothetical protein